MRDCGERNRGIAIYPPMSHTGSPLFMTELQLRKEYFDPSLDQIAQREQRRQELLAEGEFSLPKEVAALAILVSRADHQGLYSPDEYRAFMAEAEQAKDRKERLGEYDEVVIIPEATQETFRTVLGDPEIAGLVVIAHGNIAGVVTTDPYPAFTWTDVAAGANHLKQGEIEQATCGHFPLTIPRLVPLGTFAVKTLSSVRAAVGKILPEEPLDHERILEPVYTDDQPLLEQIESLNARHRGRKRIIDATGEVVRYVRSR